MATASFALRPTDGVFVVAWWLVVLLHIMCATYYAVMAYAYVYVPTTLVIWAVIAFHIAIDPAQFTTVAILFGVVAAVHVLMVAHIVVVSLGAGTLRLSHEPQRAADPVARSRVTNSKHIGRHLSNAFYTAYDATLGDEGLLGVEHPHFERVLLARETVQVVLQTMQAQRMSNKLANSWLNWGVVTLLVVKCVVTPLIFQRVKQQALARFLSIVAGLVLDVVAFLVLPMILIYPYYENYNPVTRDFATACYFTGRWMIDLFNEVSIIAVQSGWDVAIKMLVAANIITSVLTCRHMLHRRPGRRSVHPTGPGQAMLAPKDNQGPLLTTSSKRSIHMVVQPNGSATSQEGDARSYNPLIAKLSLFLWRVTDGFYWLFLVLGALIFVLALRATVAQRSDPLGCAVKAYPWFGDKPACTLVEVNCLEANTTGVRADIDAIIAKVDPERVLYLTFRHCSALQVPPSIQNFNLLKVLRFDNSTIAEWTRDAAITDTHHKDLVMVLLTRVNMSGIPDGFLDPDFPKALQDIEFCVTNLSTVPSNLADIWPRDMWFTMDHARFEAIPDAFIQLEPGYLSMFANQLTTIPPAALLNHAMVEISRNPITALPDLVDSRAWANASSIRFADTAVVSLPNWMTLELLQTHSVVAGNTPVCNNASVLPSGVDRQ
ncbi:TPA: hypothetical protein N0F65_005745 [Lagenidium giganteum]|uniref:Leucine-rich repeat domain, L domain-like n=1 Tax=Lagenidium giganteum TaxID=4803 RepID=A0AAV2YY97_9STRA|nr:TPA: hypothetical protein N0F65_005745 [Lagenidium giganteum]